MEEKELDVAHRAIWADLCCLVRGCEVVDVRDKFENNVNEKHRAVFANLRDFLLFFILFIYIYYSEIKS